MSKFKKGDRVRALESSTGFTKGHLYTVRCGEGGMYNNVLIERDDLNSTTNGWAPRFFELSSTTHIVASTTHGPSLQPYVHTSREAAIEEAERLARDYPGDEFAVYERVAGRVINLTVTET